MRTFVKSFLGTACMVFCLALPSWAVTVLPDPVFPNAVQYDDFYSYSAKILTELGYEGYDVATGTGGLDLILLTGAGGFPNDNLPGDDFDDVFPGPVDYVNPATSGTWSTSLDLLTDYMEFAFGPGITIPVFTFDLNQTGSTAQMFVTAKVSILDGDTEIASWAFDNLTNGVYDPDDEIFVPDTITIEYPAGTFITVDNNLGSGKMDFLVVAPTMDLMDYYGNGYTFNASFSFTGLNNGFEEIFLTGAFTPNQQVVPEPTTMVLLGLGITALAFIRRGKMN